MSRLFNGTSDNITFSAGAANIVQGPITMVALVRPASVSGERPVFAGWSGSGFGYIHLVVGGQLLVNDYFGSGPTINNDVWQWLVITKDAGNATPDFYVKEVGGSWAHTAGNQAAFDDADVASQIFFGYDGGGHWSGRAAVGAIFASVLTSGQIQAACTLSAADLYSAGPDWMVRFNQASTATAVTDDTGNGGDQTAISGTTVDADEPVGWSYELTSGITQAIGVASETDAAQALARRKSRTIGVAAETDAAQPLGRAKVRALGLATETDAARTVAAVKGNTLGVAAETGAAQTLAAHLKRRTLGLATETDAARALTNPNGGTVVHPPRIGTITRPDSGLITVPRRTWP